MERVAAGRGPVGVDADVVGAGVERPFDSEVGVASAVVVLHDAAAPRVEQRAHGVQAAARLHHDGASGRDRKAEVVRVVAAVDDARCHAREGDARGGRARIAMIVVFAASFHVQRGQERTRIQHRVRFRMLGGVVVNVVRPPWRRLVIKRPAQIAEILARP